MVDPVGIVGLTFAIFDQLLKLGERSAELTSDIRAFTGVSESFMNLCYALDVVVSPSSTQLGEIIH